MQYGYNLLEIIQYLDPAVLTYQEWLAVGMALKDAGYEASVWDEWSRRDAARYHAGECFNKWGGFAGKQAPVTAGTIVHLARMQGWSPPRQGCDIELDWSASIGSKDELVIVDKNWLEGKEVAEPAVWDPASQLITYLETLFESSENVGYVTRSWNREGRHMPTKGCFDRTAGQLIEQLSRCDNGDIGSILGDYNQDAGAWIRFNPLDGRGCKNENVTDYRYALVESDSMDIDKQNAIIRELELPVACLVHSGHKSLHAIIRIEARNYEEYRKRVDYLYAVCKKNGLEVDSQNRNPSRLSRMPGVMRGDRRQYLVDINIGRKSWMDWYEWIEGINDDLPEPENMAKVWNSLPELSPPLIDGILRQGHKMLLAGPSKAGKSYALIELCCAIAEGRSWLGFECAQGRVMYVNLELDRASCLHRFKDVYSALKWEPCNLTNIDIWNLRGKSIPMDKLAPKLIRRASKRDYIAIIIDPIYKIITGDENSADQMAHFCNQFDKVCAELECAVVYCHHHSKGAQGGKRSMDRASGSGVFARDPDALLDMIELDLTDDLIHQEESKAIARMCECNLNKWSSGWEDNISQDDLCSGRAMQDACRRMLPNAKYRIIEDAVEAIRKDMRNCTAWRIEGTLREFQRPESIDVWFRYPVHHVDICGCLKDASVEGDTPPWKRAMSKRTPKESKRADRKQSINVAFEACSINGEVTVGALAEYTGKSEDTVRRHLKEHGGFWVDGGTVGRKGDAKT